MGDCSDSHLSPVELLPAQFIELAWRELAPFSSRGDLIRLLDERGPNLRFRLLAQLIVFDTKVDAALDRLVEDGHPVRRQDHHALEVLELPEEDGDEGVVLQVVLRARFEEDVGFVEEEDGFPARDEVEDFREADFEFFGVETEVSGAYLWGESQ